MQKVRVSAQVPTNSGERGPPHLFAILCYVRPWVPALPLSDNSTRLYRDRNMNERWRQVGPLIGFVSECN